MPFKTRFPHDIQGIATDCKLPDLIESIRVVDKAGMPKNAYELWVSLPHNPKFKFPLFTIAMPTEKLRGLITENMIYRELPLNRNYYLEVTFIGKYNAKVFVKYQHIIGSRLLCEVKQSDVVKFFNGVKA